MHCVSDGGVVITEDDLIADGDVGEVDAIQIRRHVGFKPLLGGGFA